MSIGEILSGAIALDSTVERRKYLDERCGSNSELRAQVESLLAAHQQAGGFLKGPPGPVSCTTILPRVSESTGSIIGRYKLLQEIGEGGFGIVFMAEQQHPVRRKVALKIIKPGMDSKDVIARFEAERQALAMMDHPNIAHVLDGGTTETGRPFFVMELVKGKSITEYCDANKLGVRQRLELHADVCQAVQHAHNKGVIHRDLKPSNTMITLHDGIPVVKVIDFGVSKALNQQLTERTLFTAYGQMVGTPQYMSPEQAEMSGLDVDTRSDVYSLGVMLYELLTGSTPLTRAELDSASYSDMQRMIREKEPQKPSTRISTAGEELTILADHRSETPQRLHQLVRGDLDWIVMKALEKDRTRRYETAAGFANDIQRYLDDEPVKACPPSIRYRVWKFYRRNRGLVAAAVLLAAMLVLAVTGTTTGWIRAMLVRHQLEEQKETLAQKSDELEEQKDAAIAGQRREQTLRQQAERDRELAEQERRKAERNLYMTQMQLAHHALSRPHAGTIEDTLERWLPMPGDPDYRGWEWYYLLGQSRKNLVWTLHDHVSPVRNVDWSPDNRRFASVGDDGVVRIWDVTTGKEIAQLARTELAPCRLRWSPDGATIATGHHDGTLRLWDGTSYEEKAILRADDETTAPDSYVTSVSFSGNGKTVAEMSADGSITIWDVTSQQLKASIRFNENFDDFFPQMDLSPNGQRVLAVGPFACKVWDIEKDELVLDLREKMEKGGGAAWSPNGKQIAAAIKYDPWPQHVVVVFDSETGKSNYELRGHMERVLSVAWSASGKRIVTASWDHTIRSWNAADGTLLQTLQGHSGQAWDATYSNDDQYIISGAEDGTVRIWANRLHALAGESTSKIHVDVSDLLCASWDPKGRFVATGHVDNVIRVWELVTCHCVKTLEGHTSAVACLDWSPDGNKLVSGGFDKTVKIWNVETENELISVTGHYREVEDVAWSPNGEWIASVARDDPIKIWKAGSGKHIKEFPNLNNEFIWAVGWSHDSSILACSSSANVRVWNFNSGQILFKESIGGRDIVGFSPNDKQFAFVSEHNVVLLNLDRLPERKVLRGHTATVANAVWSPDGSRLATSGFDGAVRIWDTEVGQEMMTLTGATGPLILLNWSPNGRSLVAGSRDGTIEIWDASKGYALVEHPTFLAGQTLRRLHLAQELIAQGNLEKAGTILSVVVKWKPDDTNILWNRLTVYARMRQWRKTAEDLSRICELDPSDLWIRALSAQSHLLIQDTERYCQDCIELLKEAENRDPDEGPPLAAAWVCLIAPDLSRDLSYSQQAIDQVYEEANKGSDKPFMRLMTRIIDIRRGKATPEPEPPAEDSTPLQQAGDHLWNAIRLIQLEQVEEAREHYEQAQKLIQSEWEKGFSEQWWLGLSCAILTREVEQRLK